MYITRETDYAVRISVSLAERGERIGAAKLAELNGIPSRFTIKILRKLAEGGIVRSYMGAQGGYELAKPPKEICLLDIIETVEGTYCFSRCVSPEHDCCSHKEHNCCKTHAVYEEITNSVRDKLAAQTLNMLI